MDKIKSPNITREFARNALEKFVFEHSDCDLSCVDEILLEYLVTVLESLGKNSSDVETSFDIDEFTAMMTMFIPGFENINSASIISWMFSLAKRIETGTISIALKKNIHKKKDSEQQVCLEENVVIPTSMMSNLLSETTSIERAHANKRTECADILSDGSSNKLLNPLKKSSYRDKLQKLQDLYPGTPEDQLRRSLSYAHGNLYKAANAILSNKACQEYNQRNNSDDEDDKKELETKYPCADLLMKEKVSQLQEIFPFKSVSCLQEMLLSVGSVDGVCQLLFEEPVTNVENCKKLKVHKASLKKADLSDSDLARLKQDALSKYSLVVEKSEPYKPIVFVEKDSKVEPLNKSKEDLLSIEEQLKSCQTLTKGKKSKVNPKLYRKSMPP